MKYFYIKFQQQLAKFLKSKGRVVFYLEPYARTCGHANQGCYLELYCQGEKSK